MEINTTLVLKNVLAKGRGDVNGFENAMVAVVENDAIWLYPETSKLHILDEDDTEVYVLSPDNLVQMVGLAMRYGMITLDDIAREGLR